MPTHGVTVCLLKYMQHINTFTDLVKTVSVHHSKQAAAHLQALLMTALWLFL